MLKVNANCLLMAYLSFLVVHDIDTSRADLNLDLQKISEWAFQ